MADPRPRALIAVQTVATVWLLSRGGEEGAYWAGVGGSVVVVEEEGWGELGLDRVEFEMKVELIWAMAAAARMSERAEDVDGKSGGGSVLENEKSHGRFKRSEATDGGGNDGGDTFKQQTTWSNSREIEEENWSGNSHFGGCTGYGHDEGGGREALDNIFAEIVGAESAIVRSQFFSGTHAIACALFAFLRPGDELLAVAGAPYDTLEEVIGTKKSYGTGSLKDFGVAYREVPLAEDGGLDWDALAVAVGPQTKCALIQRSHGYSWRRSLSILEIQRAIKIIKKQKPDCMVMVDNCYGEFVESSEPPTVGADLIAGSLIKNPGGTIAPCGGYVAGRKNGLTQQLPDFQHMV